MSHRSDFFAGTSRVNIQEPSVCFTIMFLSAVSRVRLPSVLIPTTMSDSQSLNTTLLEVMVSCKSECIFVCDLSDLTFQIIFNAWWASMNAGSKRPIAWNNSRDASSWRFYLDCGIEETGCPEIICIVCHQVLCHSLEHGTRSMGKRLLAKAHIAKLNDITESEVPKLTSLRVDDTALAILKRQGSRGITIVSLQRKFIFDIQVNPY